MGLARGGPRSAADGCAWWHSLGRCAITVLAAGFAVGAVEAKDPARVVAQGSVPAAAPSGGTASGQLTPEAERVALLVGVGRYPSASRLGALEGAAADALRMKDVLMERFGFREEECRVLLDEEATHAAIVRTFNDFLIERSGSTTHALFFFSGHGSRVPDRSGVREAEPDGYDTTLVAYDSRSGVRDGSRDVSDDELRSLLAKLVERTPNVVVITDACHSGGGVRGISVEKFAPQGAAQLDLGWLTSFWPDDVPFTDDDAPPLPADRYLHVAACRRGEKATEVKISEGSRAGLLTFHLTRGMERARPGDSWRTVLDDCAMRIATSFPGQSVTYAGAVDRALFGGDFQELLGFRARHDPRSREVWVDAGTLHGLRLGSELEVRDARSVETLGRIRIERLTDLVAWGAWLEEPPSIRKGGLRALEISRTAQLPPLRVHVADHELAFALAASQRIAASDVEAAMYQLGRAENELRFRTEEGLELYGERLPQVDQAGWVDELEQVFRDELQWLALFALANETGKYPLTLTVRQPSDQELERTEPRDRYTALETIPSDAAGGERAVQGGYEDLSSIPVGLLEIKNPYSIDLFVSVLSVSEDRGCTLLRFAGSETNVFLPKESAAHVLFGAVIRRDWPFARPMRDRYIAIATTQPADFALFGRSPALRGQRRGLPPLLELAIEHADATRGDNAARVNPEGWGVRALDLLVVKP